ncbi:hypothetical protein [Methylomonas koyamae]|uniref:hypothetical protein n=1 Tax=Methylomonas koyamae TaxID=702114 RepID=UPI000B09E564|nr:hypothetical protein [Methylomonas koyamae]
MQPDKLLKNISILKSKIIRKPAEYEADYALTFDASFLRYTRTSTVNLISSISEALFEYRWPFPAYFLVFSKTNYGKIKFYFGACVILTYSRLSKKVKSFLYNKTQASSDVFSKEYVNDIMVSSFYFYERCIFDDWKKNHNFQGKNYLVDNIRSCYKNGLWYACITSAFPLLDLLCRKFFKSSRLDKDISSIISILNKSGVTSKHLKPGHIAWETAENQGKSGDEAIKMTCDL